MGLVEDFVALLFCSPTTVLGATVLLLLLYHLFASLSPNPMGEEPPGPKPLPLFGNLLQIDLKRPYRTLCEFAKTYGNVSTVYFGINKVVVLAGYDTVKEALVNYAEEFGDRDINPIFEDMTHGHGIIFANGATWRNMRRFALSTLKDFGMGKPIAEEKILEECDHVIQAFENHKEKPFYTGPPLMNATANVVSSVVYGSRFEYEDPLFKNLVDRTSETFNLTGSASILLYNLFPRLAYWVKNRQIIMRNVKATKNDIKDLIKHLKATLNPHECRGLVDCFLIEAQKEEDSRVTDTHFTEENLVYTLSNLFSAGTDTTAATLKWGVLLMAKYPHIQDKVQEELRTVVGSRPVRVDDRKRLPYTNAVIHETQRLGNIVPMSLGHRTSRDVTFQGFFIKKDTAVLPLLASVLYDESKWETPHTFNPSHFLDAAGKFTGREALLPFSAGRRVCLGESLARMELFLFFTSLLQRFRFTPPPGISPSDLDLTPTTGFTLNPMPQKLCAVSLQ